MSLKLNVMADAEFRKELLDLVRDQIRPLVDQVTGGAMKDAVRARIEQTLTSWNVRDVITYESKQHIVSEMNRTITPLSLKEMVREAVAERIDVMLVSEMSQLIRPLVRDALRSSLAEMIK